MPFDEVERVRYGNKPLERVMCQFRYPPVLRIESEAPTEYQERIQDGFPRLEEATEVNLRVGFGIGSGMPPDALREAFDATTVNNYAFNSADGNSKINLTKSFMTLSDSNYQRWENFISNLSTPFQALIDIYSPMHFSRIGLRYIDIIDKAALGLEGTPWSELLQPQFLGLLSSSVGQHVLLHESQSDIRLADDVSLVKLRIKFARGEESNDGSLTFDSDFFRRGEMTTDGALSQLDYFHERAFRLFRWAITDRLHQAMEPSPL